MTRMITLIRKVTARHFRAGGMDVTADQLADQIISSMQAVADGRIMSALPPKADIREGAAKRLLMTHSGSKLFVHTLHAIKCLWCVNGRTIID